MKTCHVKTLTEFLLTAVTGWIVSLEKYVVNLWMWNRVFADEIGSLQMKSS